MRVCIYHTDYFEGTKSHVTQKTPPPQNQLKLCSLIELLVIINIFCCEQTFHQFMATPLVDDLAAFTGSVIFTTNRLSVVYAN